MSLVGYGSKILKVNGYRATVSIETIVATKREFFFTKVAPVQSITDTVLLGFWLMLLPWMFISSYTTIYFFVNNFFSNVYVSVTTIFKCFYLFFGWEIDHPSKYVRNWGNGWGSSKRCAGAYWWWGLKNQSKDTYVLNGSAKYTRASSPARKMSLFSSIVIAIILSYAKIRI